MWPKPSGRPVLWVISPPRFHVVVRDALYVEQCDDPGCTWEHYDVDSLPWHYRAEAL